ncbi:MAG: RNA chaperone Hfq [Rickettsiales bacterium TMED254]|nr:RNA chaperone Hfq [Rickettsiales bacterium]RPF77761.1 MAG: RNA chaperone Hfq [Rickettsiales bacterium TMED254]
MINKKKTVLVQDIFLEDTIKSNKTIEINLVNGLIIKCRVINCDNFSILVIINSKKALIYKHSIAYIK